MYKGGGQMHGVVSKRRPAPSTSPSPSPSPSLSLSSSPSLSSNPQPLHADGKHGHIGPSSDPQEHIRRQLGHMRTESPSVQHTNDEGNTCEEDSRFMICPYGDSFTDATYVVRQLNKIVNNYWRGQWISYSSAPKEVTDLWWNEFKRKFRWDETEDDEVKRIFKKEAGDHIRNVMNKAKRSQVKQDFITSDNWTEMKRTWETEKNKQMSEPNKKNRASSSSEGSATYAGGSINIREHRKRMADELGTEPTYTAIVERTFKKKGKTWTGDRAKAIKEKYDELLMSTASGGDGVAASEPSVDNMALWVEASGGMKRGKIFGMESLLRVYTTKAATTSSFNADVSRRTRLEEQMTQELSQLKHLLVEKDEEIKVIKHQYESLKLHKDEEIRQINERYKSLESQTRLILQHLNLNHDQVPSVPLTNQIGDGHNDERHNDDEIAADDDDFVSRFID